MSTGAVSPADFSLPSPPLGFPPPHGDDSWLTSHRIAQAALAHAKRMFNQLAQQPGPQVSQPDLSLLDEERFPIPAGQRASPGPPLPPLPIPDAPSSEHAAPKKKRTRLQTDSNSDGSPGPATLEKKKLRSRCSAREYRIRKAADRHVLEIDNALLEDQVTNLNEQLARYAMILTGKDAKIAVLQRQIRYLSVLNATLFPPP